MNNTETRSDLLAARATATANIKQAVRLGLTSLAQQIRRDRKRIDEKIAALDA